LRPHEDQDKGEKRHHRVSLAGLARRPFAVVISHGIGGGTVEDP
jgi:hypothetical protein